MSPPPWARDQSKMTGGVHVAGARGDGLVVVCPWIGGEMQIQRNTLFPLGGELWCWPAGGRHILPGSGSDWTPDLCPIGQSISRDFYRVLLSRKGSMGCGLSRPASSHVAWGRPWPLGHLLTHCPAFCHGYLHPTSTPLPSPPALSSLFLKA